MQRSWALGCAFPEGWALVWAPILPFALHHSVSIPPSPQPCWHLGAPAAALPHVGGNWIR